MKFGQDLNENLVSEWRHQYLDYKKGKKKLKKLAKQTHSASANNSKTNTPFHGIFQNRPSPSHNRASIQRLNQSQDGRQNNIRPNFGSVSGVEPSQGSVASLSSFQLPSPAIHFNNRDNSTNNTNSRDQGQTNDRTPLLLHSDPAPGGGSSEVRRRNTDVPAPLYTRDSSDRNSIHRLSLPGDPHREATELDDLVLFTKKEFIEWVDEELDKVDTFYTEKESDCLTRYLILQDQIAQLREQNAASQQRYSRVLQATTGVSSHHVRSDNENDNDSDSDSGREDADITSVMSRHRIARNFKIYTFWTKRKLRLINKLDTPSLPSFSWLHGNGKVEKQYYEEGYSDDSEEEESGASRTDTDMEQDPNFNRKDYSRRRHKVRPQKHVPYFQARRRLKEAMYEFYRSMELLKSYRLLNRTAFRKIIKKYDKTTEDDILPEYMKKVDQAHFVKSDVLENLIGNVEELFTNVFEGGNRKIAITKLRRKEGEETYYTEFFSSGIFIGLAIPLLVFAIYNALHKTIDGTLPEGRYLLQIWGGFLMINLMALLIGINCMIWNHYKVNYKFVFEFNTKDALDAKQYFLLPSLFLFALGFFAWFSFANLFPVKFNGRDWPFMYFGMSLIVLFCPFDIFYLNARIWLIATMWRLIFSGFYPVEFRDFFVGDIFSSLTYSIGNLYTFICLYGSHWSGCLDGSGTTSCGSSTSRGMGFLSTIPSIWRFLQCFRRYADTGDWFPHLANMLKYFISTMYYMALSLYRIETVAKYKALLITFGATNAILSSAWDLLMDWSLFQFNSENFLLRDELAFKSPWVYYVAMLVNVVLRFQWVFYALFSEQIQQSAVTSFGIGLAEVIRRWVWLLFRLENEHSTNVHLFRASRETPLPYPVLLRRKVPRRPLSSRFDLNTTIEEEDEVEEEPEGLYASNSDLGDIRRPSITVPLPQANEDDEVSIASIPSSIESELGGEIPLTYSPKFDAESNASIIPYPHSKYFLSDDRASIKLAPIRSVSSAASRRTSLYQSPKSTNILENLSRVLTNAHIKDFQRRKTEKVRYSTAHHDGSTSDLNSSIGGGARSYRMRPSGSGSGSGSKSMQSFNFTSMSMGGNDNDNFDDEEEDDLDTDEDIATERMRHHNQNRTQNQNQNQN